MTAVPPGLLVEPDKLSRFNVPSAFLAQFEPRPFSILITTPGDLGTMAFAWKWPSDSEWSAPITSDAGASWAFTLDDAFADLTFAAHAYVADAVYTIDRNGAVVGGAEVTPARYDLRQNACSSVTSEAMMLMRDAIRPPLLAWGDDATTHAAAWAYALLKRGRGATPTGAGAGDDLIFTAEEMAKTFFAGIGKNGKPDSMIDSSSSDDGPLFPAYPTADASRGW
jgi:hypothetical protein